MEQKKNSKKSKPISETKQEENLSVQLAKLYAENVTSTAFTISNIHKEQLDLTTLTSVLEKQVQKVLDGDTRRIETMLMTQAQTLNIVFHHMMNKITQAGNTHQLQAYSDIAIKAQNSCRKTLSTLADLKHPRRATFVKQQNLATNQQINNASQTQISKNSMTNELLTEQEYATLDDPRAFTTIPIDPQMEALEAWRCEDI